jgi:hypothetical protein
MLSNDTGNEYLYADLHVILQYIINFSTVALQ